MRYAYSPRNAWTLIELMAAITLVVVLALLAISVAGRLTEQSRSVACVARLKTIGSAILLYANDHQNALPGPQGEWIQLNTNLPKMLAPYLGYPASESNNQTAIWECPGNRYVTRRNQSGAYPTKMAAYLTHPPLFGLFNYPSAGTTTRPTTTLKIQKDYAPADRWLLRDVDYMAYSVPNDAAIGGKYGPVHQNGRNVFYLEGHVQWMPSRQGVKP